MTVPDTLLHDIFAPARSLEPSEFEVTAVIECISRRSKRPARRSSVGRRAMVPALLSVTALLVGAYAVPVTRAAIEDAAGGVTDVFDGWADGDTADIPGRALRAGEAAPVYFRAGAWSRRHVHEPRVIAEAGGYKLYAYRERNGSIGFDLGNTGVAAGGFTAAHFKHRSLFLLGPGAMSGPDERGHIPWFGLAARSVAAVEVHYETGPPLRVDHIDGAFVLLVEPDRDPRQAVATDAAGQVIGRQPFPGA
jgi:hypothetical protein